MNFQNGYALIIGIADYPYVRKLPNTVIKDARDIHDVFKSSSCGYPENHLKMLLNQEATGKNIREAMSWLCSTTREDDTAVVYFSCHGGRKENGPDQGSYLIPYDAQHDKLKETAISSEELTAMIRQIRARRVLLLFDFCYSGGTGEPKSGVNEIHDFKGGYDEPFFDNLAQGRGRVIIASSRATEVSVILSGMDNSLFTYYLIKALQGEAYSRGDGLVRVFDVFHYVADQVKTRHNQHPVFKAADLEDNFPVALFRSGVKSFARYQPDFDAKRVVNKTKMRGFLLEYFSSEDIQILCADIQEDLKNEHINLQVSLDIVGGTSLPARVQNLIDFMDRRGYLSYLITAARKSRPGISALFLSNE